MTSYQYEKKIIDSYDLFIEKDEYLEFVLYVNRLSVYLRSFIYE